MLKEMGNQNTSGIAAADEKAADEVQERAQEVVDELKGESQAVNQEADEAEAAESEADKDSPGEKTASAVKADSGAENRHVNKDDEASKAAITDASSNPSEPRESNFEEGMSKSNSEVHDQTCPLQGGIESSDRSNLEPEVTISNSSTHEAVNTTTKPREDQTMRLTENLETTQVVNSCHIEEATCDVDAKVAQTIGTSIVSDLNNQDLEENGISNERREVFPKEEPNNSHNSPTFDLTDVRSKDLSGEQNNQHGECLVLVEEKLIMSGLEKEINASHVDQTLPPDLATERFDLDNEAKENSSQDEVTLEQLKDATKMHEMTNEPGLVQTESVIVTPQSVEENEPTQESISVNDCNKGDEVELLSQSQSLPETEKATNSEFGQNSEAIVEQYSKTGMSRLEDTEPEGHESKAKPTAELKKSPSFDFGIPFDARSEESDRTPLLYQDRTAFRSFSSCSTLRFKDRSVQTEYFGKPLDSEAAEIEEKTIRMEKSYSESSKALNLLNKDDNNNPVKKATKHENYDSGEKYEDGLTGDQDCDIVSPKGNGKRKPRSSLFTTCMCCTAAIS